MKKQFQFIAVCVVLFVAADLRAADIFAPIAKADAAMMNFANGHIQNINNLKARIKALKASTDAVKVAVDATGARVAEILKKHQNKNGRN
jgi:hypothetical protein